MSVTSSAAWRNLAQHAQSTHLPALRDLMLTDTARLARCEIGVEGLRLLYAFQRVTLETEALLVKLAEQQDVAGWRERMFGGEKINATEKRAVLHTALRRRGHAPIMVDGIDVLPDVRETQARVAAFVDKVRGGAWTGVTEKPIRAIVNIGIGGSDLGPRMAVRALRPFVSGIDAHFVANVDAFDLDSVLENLDAESALFVVVSKTFTTQETLLNAQSARRWLIDRLGKQAVAKHFVAVSVNRAEVEKFGIDAANMFPMWDWVGGRFSLWSAVGLSLALAIGNDNYRALLDGAAAMDAHFQSAPLAQNMPVMLALLGIWNGNFLGASAQAVLPYCERLRELPRYLQQLEMESNGKSVTRGGAFVDYATAPALFGDCGTVGQHSFHQWLHQGTSVVPADFIGIVEDDERLSGHHRALMSNLAAQMGALAFGQAQAASPQDVYAGGRPSSLLLLDRLDPYALGLLLALYEHKTFVQGVVWDINSFDQPGVELGKRMAKGLEGASASYGPEAAIMKSFFQSVVKN